ncbi:MAG: DUF296 domain-containing protein [Thermacetogeniaceae bacterium]
MKYSQGKVGRIFLARIEHGDDLLEELKRLATQERVETAVLYLIGALREASLVVGPQACTIPSVPSWRHFDDCREILAIGTIFTGQDGPVLHLHSATGRGDTPLTGCLRGDSAVHLVIEAMIMELLETGAVKSYDPATELQILNFHQGR